MRKILYILTCVLGLGWDAAVAQSGETPTDLPGVKIVDSAAAQTLIAQNARVIDMRRRAAFAESRLPRAISGVAALDQDTKKLDPTILGADKAATILIHGHGTDGWSAFHAVKSAAEQGYAGIHWYRGGFVDWQKQGLPLAR